MKLTNFEKYIEGIILERGQSYYEYGSVIELELVDGGLYSAEVEGSEIYEVRVEISKDFTILSSYCNCPFDQGEHCKHEVAVFFELHERLLNSDTEDMVEQPTSIRAILMASDKEKLVDFLVQLAHEKNDVAQRIKVYLGTDMEQESIQASEKLIRFYIKQHSDRDGFIDYRSVIPALNGANMVLSRVQGYVKEAENTIHGIELCLLVIRELIDLLEASDNSSGEIGGTIEESFAFIEELLTTEGLDLSDKTKIMTLIAHESEKAIYSNCQDWKLDLLRACSSLVETPEMRQDFELYLQRYLEVIQTRPDRFSKDREERLAILRYEMIERLDGAE